MMPDGPFTRKRMALYATLHITTLLACWIWFAALWLVAFVWFTWSEVEWWLLILAACAGFYGLRPNLERAIDAAWLKGATTTAALAERAAQLKPLKRRIDLVCSLVLMALLLIAAVWWFGGFMERTGGV